MGHRLAETRPAASKSDETCTGSIGLQLNKDTCEIRRPELTFLDDRLTAEGVNPDTEKVQAITDVSKPYGHYLQQTLRGNG